MKNIFAPILICLLTVGHLFSQTDCCPYIFSITIIPANPTPYDSIKIVTLTSTPNLGNEVSYSFTQQADTFNLFGCFYSGWLTEPQPYLDTTNIGILPAGTYYINYLAKLSALETSCSVIDSNSMTTSFQVTTVSGVEKTNPGEESFYIFPNPATEGINIFLSEFPGEIMKFEILDVSGKLIFYQNISENIQGTTLVFDISGLPEGCYLAKISGEEFHYSKKLIIIR